MDFEVNISNRTNYLDFNSLMDKIENYYNTISEGTINKVTVKDVYFDPVISTDAVHLYVVTNFIISDPESISTESYAVIKVYASQRNKLKVFGCREFLSYDDAIKYVHKQTRLKIMFKELM